jgi:hypothetical protein
MQTSRALENASLGHSWGLATRAFSQAVHPCYCSLILASTGRIPSFLIIAASAIELRERRLVSCRLFNAIHIVENDLPRAIMLPS